MSGNSQTFKQIIQNDGTHDKPAKGLNNSIFIVFFFLICWLPASLWHTVASFRDGPVFFDSRISVKTVLFLLQSVIKIIDPILSAFRLPEVRCCYHDVFQRC